MKATADDNTKIQATHQWGNIGKSIIQKASKKEEPKKEEQSYMLPIDESSGDQNPQNKHTLPRLQDAVDEQPTHEQYISKPLSLITPSIINSPSGEQSRRQSSN
jgi:hypothetical protein